MPSAVALVPARAGSQRVPGKNVHPLAGHPLIAYTIAAARQSGPFDAVVVSTDSEDIGSIARRYGAHVLMRPPEMATTTSPDIEWVRHVMSTRDEALFSILRPTSPFRTADTIRRAWAKLHATPAADSVRAVELCKQHPGKMWRIEGELMTPLLEQPQGAVPFHSSQYQALPEVYVQNSSLEIAWTRVIEQTGTIAGERVAPFVTEGLEGFSIDYPEDVEFAERHADRLPQIPMEVMR